jgi:hydrogenase maturation protease
MRIIGAGNAYRRDDGAGLVVARALRAANLPDVTVFEASGEGAALMELWEGAERVVVIDAVCSGAPPGTLHWIDAQQQPVPTFLFRHSTHAFGVAEAIEMARMLGRLPTHLALCGIEGQDFGHGQGLTDAVRSAIPVLLAEIRSIMSSQVYTVRTESGGG